MEGVRGRTLQKRRWRIARQSGTGEGRGDSRERGGYWPRGAGRGGKSSHKGTEKQQSRGNRQHTSRDAQKSGGWSHERTNKDMPRYIYNGRMARGLSAIHNNTN